MAFLRFAMRWSLSTSAAVVSVATMATIAHGAPREKFAEKTVPRIDARLYSQPNRYGQPISIVGKGLELKVLRYSSTRSWALVETPSKRRGWIPVASTSLGLRYSAKDLARRSAPAARGAEVAGKVQPDGGRKPASASKAKGRGPASDMNLEELGYDGSDYEQEAEDLSENSPAASDEFSGASNSVSSAPAAAAGFDISALESDGSGDSGADSGVEAANDSDEFVPSPSEAGYDTRGLEAELGGFSESGNVAAPAEAAPTRKSLRGVRTQQRAAAPVGPRIGLGAEYANQVNKGAAHGFGVGAQASFPITDMFHVGLGVYWDRFVENMAQTTLERVTRNANVFRVGPVLTLKVENFGFDALIGWARHAGNVEARNIADNSVIEGLEYSGPYSDSVFGFRLAPHFDIPIAENQFIRAYVAYTFDFSSKMEPAQAGDPPAGGPAQSIAIGAAFTFGL